MIQPPEYSSLINPVACTAFALRYVARQDVREAVTIDTGTRFGDHIDVTLLQHETQLPISDALMFIAPFVTVTTPLDPDYAGQLMLAPLYVEVDGIPKVAGEPVGRYLLAPPYIHSDRSFVFIGHREDEFLGISRLQFLANGSHIRMQLNGVPSGVGLIRAHAGVIMARYTTKVRGGEGFDVGTYNQDITAVEPIHNTWTNQNRGPLTQEKLETVHESTIQRLMREHAERMEAEKRGMKERLEVEGQARENAAYISKVVDQISERRAAEVKKRAEEDARLAKKQSTSNPELSHPVDLEATLRRAKRRLVCWGILAIWVFLCVAFVVFFVSKELTSK